MGEKLPERRVSERRSGIERRQKPRQAVQRRRGSERRVHALAAEQETGDFIARQVLDKDLKMFEG